MLRLAEEEWQAEDTTGAKRAAAQRLAPVLTVRGAELYEAQPAELPA